MTRQNGPWTIKHTTEPYSNPYVTVLHDDVIQPDGQPGGYTTVTLKAGVAILPVRGDDQVILVRQFRYALGRESLEVVSGTRDENEDPRQAAMRELREEIGLVASDWSDLGTCDIDTSIVRCPVQLFVVRSLSTTETAREGTETIETVTIPFAEAVRQVLSGGITHAPSCVLLLKARADPSGVLALTGQ
jgi:8-oxo-dGTP pyrophosphatase MutT (NUDIX family)